MAFSAMFWKERPFLLEHHRRKASTSGRQQSSDEQMKSPVAHSGCEADRRGGARRNVPLRSISNEAVDFPRRFPYVQNLSAYQIQPRVTSVSRIGNKFRKRKDTCVGAQCCEERFWLKGLRRKHWFHLSLSAGCCLHPNHCAAPFRRSGSLTTETIR